MQDSPLFVLRLIFVALAAAMAGAIWFSRHRLSAGAVRTITGLLLVAFGIYGVIAVLASLPGESGRVAGIGGQIGRPLATRGGLLSALVPLALLGGGVAHFLGVRLRPRMPVLLFAVLALFGVELGLAIATGGRWEVLYGAWGALVAGATLSALGVAGAYLVVGVWIAVNLLLAFPFDAGAGARQAGARSLETAAGAGRGLGGLLGALWASIEAAAQALSGRVAQWRATWERERARARAERAEAERAGGARERKPGDEPRLQPNADPEPSPPVAERDLPGIPPVEVTPAPSTPRQLTIAEMVEDVPLAAPPGRRTQTGGADVADYRLPPLSILEEATEDEIYRPSRDELISQADALEKKLADFGIEGSVREVSPGPVITRYEVVPAPGVKINKIANLADDLAMSLKAHRVRILAPIPGKDAVGVEVPNLKTSLVRLREILASESFAARSHSLPVALGKRIDGEPFTMDLARTPHLLIAGATGAGKSVCINAIVASLLYQASPRDLRLLMIDPKMLELSVYNGIPHLITPVITDPKDVARALHWAVSEMEQRYRKLAKLGVRSIAAYNRRVGELDQEREQADAGLLPEEEALYESAEGDEPGLEPLPYLVLIVDELADLMLTVASEIEEPIARLAQKARAVGLHLILATQRPSVNVITGVIKANFPSRIAFQVASKTDSRTILDQNGAEKLLGRGDMLFIMAGSATLERVHGALVSDGEVKRLVDYIAAQGIQADRIDFRESSDDPCVLDFDRDELYDEALKLVVIHNQGSASLLQRRLKVGYARASRLIDELEAGGIVGPFEGSKSREVLVGVDYLEQLGLTQPGEAGA